MKKNILTLTFLACLIPSIANAFWVWTPETGKWTNPKYSVKETPELQLNYAQTFYDAGKWEDAIKEYRKLIKHYPKSKQAPEAQYFIGMCFEKLEKPYGAFKEYQVIIDKYPFSERSPDVVQRQYDIAVQLMEKSRPSFMDSVAGREYNVVEIFQAVIKNAPYGKLAPQARYKMGLFLMERKMYQEARDEFEKVVNDYPDSEYAKAAKYQIAISDARRSPEFDREQKTTQIAVEELKNFVKEHPEAEMSEKAKTEIASLREKEAENNFHIAEFYEKQKKYESARIYYNLLTREYSDTSWSKKALQKLQTLGAK
jgi:outer membrane protein assembly factor BamD